MRPRAPLTVVLLLAALMAPYAAAQESPPSQATQFQRWEASFTSATVYGNPFNDVTLSVQYAGPSGQLLQGYGFWDGGNVFKIRMSFPEAGTWSYTTSASDTTNSGLHNLTGTVQVQPRSSEDPNPLYAHGPLRVSGDRRHLEHADGTPFLWIGDTLWGATVWLTETGFIEAIADRRGKHFSVLQTNLARKNEVDTNAETPWSGDRWNVNFMQKVDRMFDSANDQGMYLFVNGLVDLLWDRGIKAYRRLIQMIAIRYAAHHLSFASSMDDPHDPQHTLINQLVLDVTPHQLLAQHPGSPVDGSGNVTTAEAYYDHPTVHYVMEQTGSLDNLERSTRNAIESTLRLYRHQPPKPVINGESWYEGEGAGTARIAIHLGYLTMLSGGAGHTYGTDLWDATDADLPAWKNKQGALYMQHLRDFFIGVGGGRPLIPVPELIRGAAPSYADRQVLARTVDGDQYILFMPNGGSITVDLSALDGSALAVSWYDPLAGTYTDDAQRVGGGIQSFASPLASAMVVLKIARLDGVVVNPAPTATGLSPSDAEVGGAAFTLTVSGSNFLEESVVRWNGTARPTTFVSDTLVTAAIGVTDIATMGSASITVFNPGPGGGNSNALAFAITGNPVPTVAGLSPGSAAAGGAAFTLTVNGSNFIQGAKVRWKGLDRPTAYEDASRLTASIPSEDIVEAGPAAVTVFNPGPGGGTSNAMTFTVAEPNPVPTATNLSPGSATAGGAAFTLTVNGSNFTQGSKVQWKGVDKPTSFVNPTRLTAAISMADIAAAGPAAVTVFNPTPGGGTSNTLTFTVASGPALKVNATSVAPGTAVTVTLEGGLGGARDWLGLAAVASANTSYLTWTYVGTGVTTRTWTVTVAAGTWEFRLFQNDGYTRLATSPTVTAMGNPTASSLSPASAAPGGGNFTLTVTGSNFTPSSVVRWKGVDKPTSYVNATRVTAAIPAADIAVAGPAAVTVFNPAPGGGTSNALTFSVVAGPTLRVNATSVTPGTAVTVTLEGGPGGSTAWLSLAAAGSPNASYVTWTYVGGGVATRTWTVTVGAGTWEFRLFVDSGFTRMATSPTITAAGTPVPSASTLSPTRTAPGGGNFTLTVTGSNFIPTSVVRWKGVDKPTSYVNANQVTATILPADIAAAGSAAVTVFNPGPGGGTSNALTFTVAAVPTLRVSATRVTPGTAVTVTLEGGLGGAKDWLGLAAVGSANTSYVAWTYVGTGVTTRTWAVTLAAGTWEFRLFQNDGYTRLATSPTVTAAP